MAAFRGLLLIAGLGVALAIPLGSLESVLHPSEVVSSECYRAAEPLLTSLHRSLHERRHEVHGQCRQTQAALNARSQEQLRHINETVNECLAAARDLAARESGLAASELSATCHQLQQGVVARVDESSHLHEDCTERLRHVGETMRMEASELMHVLSQCAPQHACAMLEMSTHKMNSLAESIAALSNLDVVTVCNMPLRRVSQEIHRACERHAVTQDIVHDASVSVYTPLHSSLTAFCSNHHPEQPSQMPPQVFSPVIVQEPEHRDSFVPEDIVEGEQGQSSIPYGNDMRFPEQNFVAHMPEQDQPEEPTSELPEVVTTEPPETLRPTERVPELPEMIPLEISDVIPDVIPSELPEMLPTERLPYEFEAELPDAVEEIGSVLPEMPTLPVEPFFTPATGDGNNGWNFPFLGVGPVVIDDTMQAGQTPEQEPMVTEEVPTNQELPSELVKTAVEQLGNALSSVNLDEADGSLGESSSSDDDDHHHEKHGHHHKHKWIMLSVIVGVACIIACAVSAAVATHYLRRRRRQAMGLPQEKKDVVKKSLIGSDEDDEDDEIKKIEQKGFENPTFAFFENLEEEA